MPRPWTLQDDAELMATYFVKPDHELARHFERSVQAIKMRASDLGITSQASDDADTGMVVAVQSNDLFVAAMVEAIRNGSEHPPMIGVDKRPGTRKPRYVPHGAAGMAPRTASSFVNG